MYEPFEHQKVTTDFINSNPRCLITSDPGTGKTRSVLDAIKDSKTRTLVLAPLSILESSWGDDIEKFTPDITYVCAYSKNREKAFLGTEDVVITNHDAVKWIAKNYHVLCGFDTLVIDEFTAFKNKDSQRSKACRKIAEAFTNRIAMSGQTKLAPLSPTHMILIAMDMYKTNLTKKQNPQSTEFVNTTTS